MLHAPHAKVLATYCQARQILRFRIEGKIPKTLKSQTTTRITTTAFKIDLIELAIGMKVFTSQSRTPITIRDIRISTTGMSGKPPSS
jgi:hypothetical protein